MRAESVFDGLGHRPVRISRVTLASHNVPHGVSPMKSLTGLLLANHEARWQACTENMEVGQGKSEGRERRSTGSERKGGQERAKQFWQGCVPKCTASFKYKCPLQDRRRPRPEFPSPATKVPTRGVDRRERQSRKHMTMVWELERGEWQTAEAQWTARGRGAQGGTGLRGGVSGNYDLGDC